MHKNKMFTKNPGSSARVQMRNPIFTKNRRNSESLLAHGVQNQAGQRSSATSNILDGISSQDQERLAKLAEVGMRNQATGHVDDEQTADNDDDEFTDELNNVVNEKIRRRKESTSSLFPPIADNSGSAPRDVAEKSSKSRRGSLFGLSHNASAEAKSLEKRRQSFCSLVARDKEARSESATELCNMINGNGGAAAMGAEGSVRNPLILEPIGGAAVGGERGGSKGTVWVMNSLGSPPRLSNGDFFGVGPPEPDEIESEGRKTRLMSGSVGTLDRIVCGGGSFIPPAIINSSTSQQGAERGPSPLIFQQKGTDGGTGRVSRASSVKFVPLQAVEVCRDNREVFCPYEGGVSERYFTKKEKKNRLELTESLFWRSGIM